MRLTEAERDLIADVWDEETTASPEPFYPVVARILTARLAWARAADEDAEVEIERALIRAKAAESRLAAVEALADEWRLTGFPDEATADQMRRDLAAALTPEATP